VSLLVNQKLKYTLAWQIQSAAYLRRVKYGISSLMEWNALEQSSDNAVFDTTYTDEIHILSSASPSGWLLLQCMCDLLLLFRPTRRVFKSHAKDVEILPPGERLGVLIDYTRVESRQLQANSVRHGTR
jgi:hypothetical protein